jgi:hypothetical protein
VIVSSSRSHLAPLVAALSLAYVACGATQPYASLAESAEPLRTQFNNDTGRVRIVMLVAPT